jgi:hypothetical protein
VFRTETGQVLLIIHAPLGPLLDLMGFFFRTEFSSIIISQTSPHTNTVQNSAFGVGRRVIMIDCEEVQCVAILTPPPTTTTCAWYHMKSARNFFTRVELKSSELKGLPRVQGPVDFLLQRLFRDSAGQRDLALQANEGNSKTESQLRMRMKGRTSPMQACVVGNLSGSESTAISYIMSSGISTGNAVRPLDLAEGGV